MQVDGALLQIFGPRQLTRLHIYEIAAPRMKQHDNFKSKGKEYILVGYSDTAKAYRLYERAFVDIEILSKTAVQQNDNEKMNIEEVTQDESDYESADDFCGFEEVPERMKDGRESKAKVNFALLAYSRSLSTKNRYITEP
ncbi:hypothetical protein FF38_04320 [Lucilia cuprina]|uniref:Uncharacterized protein n=1 Tax=Lucilia cuprina TaxID=7375 RepID=A0A0L0BPF7_LUCCU|nr:hypothetical protein FF38_04320 [Lucilia cuprina]